MKKPISGFLYISSMLKVTKNVGHDYLNVIQYFSMDFGNRSLIFGTYVSLYSDMGPYQKKFNLLF